MKKVFQLDDITWNDLSMDKVYDKLNKAESSVGQEYLKKVLRSMLTDKSELEKRSRRVEFFIDNKNITNNCRKEFKKLGKTKKLSLYDYIFRFSEIKAAGNGIHYLMIILLLAAIAMIFIQPVIGICSLVIMFIINISSYFKYKSGIEGYFMCFKYIIRMVKSAEAIIRILEKNTGSSEQSNNSDVVYELVMELKKTAAELSSMKKGSWLLTNSVSGSLVDVIMDYVRMLFHVDIIRFNSMRKMAAEKAEKIDRLFCLLGEIETDICIADFRQSEKHTCIPDLKNFICGESELIIKDMYHPLTGEIVTNDLTTVKSILLTGSNASGKSTFLKQMAINQIFAQTIYTCLASQFVSGFFRVISSMALTDNILGNESYFIVEIKSLKRIIDAIKMTEAADDSVNNVPVMCFIDEVLRGTNTKERIAASGQILKKMSHEQAICFAATHDIELTEILDRDMNNYHFEEFVNGNDVEFDYKIKTGPAKTRNAILLMKAMGFDKDIIEAANSAADQM